MTTIFSQHFDRLAIEGRRGLLPVGLQLRPAEGSFTLERDVGSHGRSLIVRKRVALFNYHKPQEARMAHNAAQLGRTLACRDTQPIWSAHEKTSELPGCAAN
jgi:hypothetical protein